MNFILMTFIIINDAYMHIAFYRYSHSNSTENVINKLEPSMPLYM